MYQIGKHTHNYKTLIIVNKQSTFLVAVFFKYVRAVKFHSNSKYDTALSQKESSQPNSIKNM